MTAQRIEASPQARFLRTPPRAPGWARILLALVAFEAAAFSSLLFGTTTGLPVLDVLDKFVNAYGIVASGFLYVLLMAATKTLPKLAAHINGISSFKVGKIWYACVAATFGILGYMLVSDSISLLDKNYGGYPDWFLNIFGWGMSLALVAGGLLLSALPWKKEEPFDADAEDVKGDEK